MMLGLLKVLGWALKVLGWALGFLGVGWFLIEAAMETGPSAGYLLPVGLILYTVIYILIVDAVWP